MKIDLVKEIFASRPSLYYIEVDGIIHEGTKRATLEETKMLYNDMLLRYDKPQKIVLETTEI